MGEAAFKLAVDQPPAEPPDGPTVGISISYPNWLLQATTQAERHELDACAEMMHQVTRAVLRRVRGVE